MGRSIGKCFSPLGADSSHRFDFFVHRHDLGSLPAWLVRDKCRAAVAVATYLDMVCIRCGVHAIAIPLRHLVWPPDTRRKPNQQHVQPKEVRFVTPMEKVRPIGKHFYKNTKTTERIGTRLRSARA